MRSGSCSLRLSSTLSASSIDESSFCSELSIAMPVRSLVGEPTMRGSLISLSEERTIAPSRCSTTVYVPEGTGVPLSGPASHLGARRHGVGGSFVPSHAIRLMPARFGTTGSSAPSTSCVPLMWRTTVPRASRISIEGVCAAGASWVNERSAGPSGFEPLPLAFTVGEKRAKTIASRGVMSATPLACSCSGRRSSNT